MADIVRAVRAKSYGDMQNAENEHIQAKIVV